MATEGGDPPAVDAPDAPGPPHADIVITTVVSADEPRPPAPADDDDDDLKWVWADSGPDDGLRRPQAERQPAPAEAPPAGPATSEAPPAATAAGNDDDDVEVVEVVAEAPPPPPPPTTEPAGDLAAIEARLAGLESLPTTVETMGKAVRHELERCANVLFGHDRALSAVATRLDGLEAPTAPAPADGPPVEERVLEWLEDMNRRLGAMESRVEPLEPLPTVVQALRRAVRANDDLIVGETGAREQALAGLAGQQAAEAQSRDDALRRLLAQDLDRISGISQAQAKGLADVAERLAAVETRLTPLDSVPEDVAALSRILRRELDAIVSDNQARDQMLRRALQNEIDQLRATSEAREALAQALAGRLDALEARSAETGAATGQALAAAVGRFDTLDARVESVDRIGTEVEALRETVVKEMELLQSGARAHDQLAGELTRRLSAVDGRMARLDPLPGEVQSLRTAMLQEAERTVGALRATDERLGQLAWVPGEFQEARKRIMSLTSGVQAGQDQLRQLETAMVSVNERLEALRTRLAATAPPGPPG